MTMKGRKKPTEVKKKQIKGHKDRAKKHDHSGDCKITARLFLIDIYISN